MLILGIVVLLGMMLLAVVAAGLTLWSGWRTVRDELIARNFRSNPPGAGGIALTLVGVVLPIVLIALFLLALAAWLFGVMLAQFR